MSGSVIQCLIRHLIMHRMNLMTAIRHCSLFFSDHLERYVEVINPHAGMGEHLLAVILRVLGAA